MSPVQAVSMLVSQRWAKLQRSDAQVLGYTTSVTALLRSSTLVRFLMHPNLIGERSPRWLAHFRLTNPVNGHDLGNHCPTPAVTSAVLTSNSNCLPRLTLSRPQINALMQA